MSVEIVRAEPGIDGWLKAAYKAKSKRIVLLEAGDELEPEFYPTYGKVICPALDRGDAGMAVWRGRHDLFKFVGNVISPTKTLLKALADDKGPVPSPSLAVLNRSTAIRAIKEAQDTLWQNESLEVPLKRLGTELLLYGRHAQVFKRWLYVDQQLTKEDDRPWVKPEILQTAYDIARRHALSFPPPPSPRILLTYSAYEPKDEAAKERQQIAQASWTLQTDSGEIIGFPYSSERLPKIRELLDHASAFALPEDMLCYANSDAGLTTSAAQKLIAGVSRGFGVTCCAKRAVPGGCSFYSSVKTFKRPGGIEMFAMTPAWWKRHRELMPDMFIGREAWDAVLMTLAEEWADGVALPGTCDTDFYHKSKAHTDDVCWHVEHQSFWSENRRDDGNRHNRGLARAFFAARNKKTIWEFE